MRLVFKGKVKEVVVEHRDRLCQFGCDFMEWLFEHSGTKFTVEDKMDDSLEDDLTKDLMSITTVFSARYNGMQRYRKINDVTKDENSSNEESGEDIETVDRNESPSIQQSTKSSKKRRKEELPDT